MSFLHELQIEWVHNCRQWPIRGLMPMSDVPMSAWLNRPILILMFKTGFQPVVCNARTWKMQKTQHVQGWNRFCPYPYRCIAFFCIFRVRVRALLILVFFISIANPACTEYDWFETSLYSTILPDQYCRLVWRKLSILARVGRSTRLLCIVTRPILAVSCSSQYLMQVSSKRLLRYCRFLCHVLSAISLSNSNSEFI